MEAQEVRYLTVPEVARELRISRNLAYTLARQGQIPTVRFGRTIRVSRKALDELVEVDQ